MMIGTHDGVFHADEVFAVAALLRIFPGSMTWRTRDPKILATCDIVVDVGGVFDQPTGRFDHHQEGGAGARENGILYSSFGLVWRRFGTEIACGDEEIARIVDERLVQPIDAKDNGQRLFEGGEAKFPGIRPVTISSIIGSLNLTWGEPESSNNPFDSAVKLAGIILDRAIRSAVSQFNTCQTVRWAIADAEDPRLIILRTFCPWTEVVASDAPLALYVAFPSETGDWRLQCVPDGIKQFGKRKPLPAAWSGKRADELAAMTDVADATFCHPNLYICGAKSREGVLKLARLAIDA